MASLQRVGISMVSLALVAGPVSGAGSEEPALGDKVTLIATPALVIAHAKEPRTFAGYSFTAGGWDRYTLPPGVRGRVVASTHVAALELEGADVKQLVAFSHRRGRWIPCALEEPTSARCVPIVSSDLVAYQIAGVVYAFSPVTSTWDQVASPRPPAVSNSGVTVTTADHLSVFGIGTGRFDTLSLEQLSP